jgi:hypothetical protein
MRVPFLEIPFFRAFETADALLLAFPREYNMKVVRCEIHFRFYDDEFNHRFGR